MLAALCAWLEKTPLSAAIQDIGWIIPISQTVHILALAVVLSSIVFVDVRLLGLGAWRVSAPAMARRFLPPVWFAVAVMAVTGAILIIGEPRRDLLNPVFQIKMLLLVAALVVTAVIQAGIAAHPRAWGEGGPAAWPARLAAGLSLAVWLAIAVCGRFIAYFMG
ncbi:MAG: hypothetical protein JWP49_619 [Phenylobacterium sp.]|nr:hypothetical protein [Phenylobacterium sp.]